MNLLRIFLLLSVFFLLGLQTNANAQTDDRLVEKTERRGAFKEPVSIPDGEEKDVPREIPYYYRQHKSLPSYFSGYVIELAKSDLPLRRDNYLFKRFGNIHVDELEGEGYSYVIKGFSSEKAAKTFLKTIVSHHVPDSQVVQYNKGKRKYR